MRHSGMRTAHHNKCRNTTPHSQFCCAVTRLFTYLPSCLARTACDLVVYRQCRALWRVHLPAAFTGFERYRIRATRHTLPYAFFARRGAGLKHPNTPPFGTTWCVPQHWLFAFRRLARQRLPGSHYTTPFTPPLGSAIWFRAGCKEHAGIQLPATAGTH